MPAPSNPTPVLQEYEYSTLDSLRSKEKYLRVLIFGPPKGGKTELLCTFPNVAIADYDGDGVKVAINKGFESRHGRRDEFIRFHSFTDPIDPKTGIFSQAVAFKESLIWLNKVINDPWAKTVGFDSLTSLAIYAHNAGLVASDKRKRSQTLFNFKSDGVLLKAMQDFGAEMGAIEQLLDQLMVIKDKHIVVIAHERTEQTDAGMVLRRSPLITGDRLRAQIAKWFDEVWHLDVRPDGKRVLSCQPKGILKDVGSRLGMPAEIIDPTYTSISQFLKEA